MICKRKLRKEHRLALRRITGDLVLYHPRAVVLYGSMARFLNEPGFDRVPNDIDLIVVCNNPLTGVESRDYGLPLELHRFRMDEMINIAKTLRYDSKPVALSKLYGKQTVKQHARDVIAACLLLGPAYRKFGIEQIELDGLTDKRDYSIHQVLFGKGWWNRLQTYARERRGPLKRFSDMATLRYDFEA